MAEAYWILSSERRRRETDPGLAEYLALEFPFEDPAWRPKLPAVRGDRRSWADWAERLGRAWRRSRRRGTAAGPSVPTDPS